MRHTLILLRHAKSDWPDGVADHDRPLSARGRRDAPRTGAWLVDNDRVPDRAAVSTALRTQETYELAAEAFPAGPEVLLLDDLYAASAGEMLEVIRRTPEGIGTLMIVSHNPGTQYLALALADEANPELVTKVHARYPTNTLTVLEFDGVWATLDPAGASIVAVESPRG
ncbi:SixA phosphatase family protein [Catenulispora rubra]|uniref:SixA phosphatase family protein n=1 Tax=Catenulispora rubra TaxID=280293 RepID=UPI0018928592|nr:histidine phosphatase family protein [Catenulispora rubra]